MGHLRDNISGILNHVRKKRPIIQCYIQDNSMFHTAHETGEHKTSILPTLLLLLLCLMPNRNIGNVLYELLGGSAVWLLALLSRCSLPALVYRWLMLESTAARPQATHSRQIQSVSIPLRNTAKQLLFLLIMWPVTDQSCFINPDEAQTGKLPDDDWGEKLAAPIKLIDCV